MQLPQRLFFRDTKTNSPTLVNNAKGSLTIGLCSHLKSVITLNSMGAGFASQRYRSETASVICFQSHRLPEGSGLSNKKALLDWLCLSAPDSVVSETWPGCVLSALPQSWVFNGLSVSEHQWLRMGKREKGKRRS